MTRSVLFIATALTLVACGGGNVCQKAAKDQEACGETVSDADIQACEDQLANCSKDDEKKVEDMYDCMVDEGFFECPDTENTTATGTGFEDFEAIFACAAKATGVSQECLDAISIGGTTTTTSFTTTTTTGS